MEEKKVSLDRIKKERYNIDMKKKIKDLTAIRKDIIMYLKQEKGLNNSDIGRLLNISRERVRQILDKNKEVVYNDSMKENETSLDSDKDNRYNEVRK